MRALFAIVLVLSLGNVYGKEPLYQAALVYHPSSGKVLVDQNGNRERVPASLVKMMVGLLVMEQVATGKHSMNEIVKVSNNASGIGGHRVYLKTGEKFTLRELLKATIIGSANDAAYAIAEHMAGSEKAFVAMMNARAKKLGMKHTHFINANGLPAGRKMRYQENKTTAYDMAKLATELLKQKGILSYTSTAKTTFRSGAFQLLNTNRQFLRSYPGADGLKTGYTRKAGFSMVGTAVQNGERLVVVVLGAKRPSDRLKAAEILLDKGFDRLSKLQPQTADATRGSAYSRRRIN